MSVPSYFYRVTVSILDRAGDKLFTYEEDFHDLNLLVARNKAQQFYLSIEDGFLNKGRWSLAYLKAQWLFMEIDEIGKRHKYILAGGGLDACVRGLQYEMSAIYKATGVNIHAG